MRRKVTPDTLKTFMRELAAAAKSPGKIYFTGGATALLLGFRDQTIDIDLRLDPEPAGVFESIAALKNHLDLNVELASPLDFIPPVNNWRERSRLIDRFGQVEFYHFHFALQALAKLERGHVQDLRDAVDFVKGGFLGVGELREAFDEIEPGLIRYPAVDPTAFRRKVRAFIEEQERRGT